MALKKDEVESAILKRILCRATAGLIPMLSRFRNGVVPEKLLERLRNETMAEILRQMGLVALPVRDSNSQTH